MSSTTTNLHLVKPSGVDQVDIDVINSNMDLIDTAVKSAENPIAVATGSNTYAAGINQLTFNDAGTWKGLDEVRLYNGTDALYCKQGVTTGLLMQDNQIKVVPVTWNGNVPAVGTMKGYISADGNYHLYDSSTSADSTSLATLRDSVNGDDISRSKCVKTTLQATGAYVGAYNDQAVRCEAVTSAKGRVAILFFHDLNRISMWNETTQKTIWQIDTSSVQQQISSNYDVSGRASNLWRRGKACSLSLCGFTNVPGKTNVHMFTLPTGYEPQYTCYFDIMPPTEPTQAVRVELNASNNKVFFYCYNASPDITNLRTTISGTAA